MLLIAGGWPGLVSGWAGLCPAAQSAGWILPCRWLHRKLFLDRDTLLRQSGAGRIQLVSFLLGFWMNGCNSGSARSSSVSSRRAAEPCKPSSLSAVSTACLAFSLPCACPLRPRRVPEFFSFALGIRGIILFCLPAGNVLHSSVSLISTTRPSRVMVWVTLAFACNSFKVLHLPSDSDPFQCPQCI